MPKETFSQKQNQEEKIEPREITVELKESYLEYAMSVIISRALPDVRDGLKPVQRRILWTMWEEGLTHNAKFRKSANVVGNCLARYHPHGDMAVYDALVRMAQDFSLRYPLIQGQGNFGSIDGDAPAAQRYTEVKLSKISEELLFDIEKETVDWEPNYDGSRKEPKYLPAKLPELLVNGTLGIAVGMATNIPPHNLNEVANALIYLIDHPEAKTEDLIELLKGPDFPTGGIIYGQKNLIEAYQTGRGSITVRAVCDIQKGKNDSFQIVISEIPYYVNKAELIKSIAQLITEKRIEGIRDLRDESDREGLRIVIELKNEANPQRILNQLFNYTELQKKIYFNMLALDEGIKPKVFSLKEMLLAYLNHRQKIIFRRTSFDLKKAEERAHILIGLTKALAVIDDVIKTIKKSKDRETAKMALIKNFQLDEIQAEAILEMKLSNLAALEREKLEKELEEKKKLIKELNLIIKEPKRISLIIKNELEELIKNFSSPRKTKIIAAGLKEFKEEDLIPNEETMVILTQALYIKRMSPNIFRAQKRGGKGTMGFELKEEDITSHLILTNTHNNLLFFTDRGKVFQIKAYEIPNASRVSKGKALQNFLEINPEEKITALVSYPAQFLKNQEKNSLNYLIMVTKNGLIKKTKLEDFFNIRRSGILAFKLLKDDFLKAALLSSGDDEIIISTQMGQAIRFKEKEIRISKRMAGGIKAIRLRKNDFVADFDIIKKEEAKDQKFLTIMKNGFAKQTPLSKYKIQKRGGAGIKTAKITNRTGEIVVSRVVNEKFKDILAFSAKGQVIKTPLKEIKTAGRATAGVKIMRLDQDDKITGVIVI